MRTLIVPALIWSVIGPLPGVQAADARHHIALENDFDLTITHDEAGKSVNVSLAAGGS